jgi:hypothetical protein
MSKNLPAPVTGSKSLTGLKGKQKRFITILQDDFNFDIIEKIVQHIGVLERGKKIKPLEKHRMLQNYYLTLLTFCVPKMKIIEDDRDKVGDRIQFNINIGDAGGTNPSGTSANNKKGTSPRASGSNVSISIPTVKQPDGSFAVDKKGEKI